MKCDSFSPNRWVVWFAKVLKKPVVGYLLFEQASYIHVYLPCLNACSTDSASRHFQQGEREGEGENLLTALILSILSMPVGPLQAETTVTITPSIGRQYDCGLLVLHHRSRILPPGRTSLALNRFIIIHIRSNLAMICLRCHNLIQVCFVKKKTKKTTDKTLGKKFFHFQCAHTYHPKQTWRVDANPVSSHPIPD